MLQGRVLLGRQRVQAIDHQLCIVTRQSVQIVNIPERRAN
jgi:hypothetical protein